MSLEKEIKSILETVKIIIIFAIGFLVGFSIRYFIVEHGWLDFFK